MKILGIFIFLLFILVHTVDAQSILTPAPYLDENSTSPSPQSANNKSKHANNNDQWDHLTINSDSRIKLLLAIQKEESIRKGGMDGYRVQIYKGTNKDEAYQFKARFLSLYPEFPENQVYVKFTNDFMTRIGDFRTRSEAISLKYKIKKNFPNQYIVEDIINFPDIDR
jgi:hypothetical protein